MFVFGIPLLSIVILCVFVVATTIIILDINSIINRLQRLRHKPKRFLSYGLVGFIVAFFIEILIKDDISIESKNIQNIWTIAIHQAVNFIPQIVIGITISWLVAGVTSILVEDIILDQSRKSLLTILSGSTKKRKILIVLPAFVIDSKKFEERKNHFRLYQEGICSGEDREDYFEAPDWVMVSGGDLSGATSLISKIMELRLSNDPVEIWFDDPA